MLSHSHPVRNTEPTIQGSFGLPMSSSQPRTEGTKTSGIGRGNLCQNQAQGGGHLPQLVGSTPNTYIYSRTRTRRPTAGDLKSSPVTRVKADVWREHPADPCLAPPPLQVVLRSAGNELARCYRGNLWAQASMLRLCGDGGGAVLQRSLRAVNEELFRDSVNWGRIVAMMELGGALSAEAAEKGDMSQVDAIAGWMEDSLDSPPLQGWIEDNGGWDAFVQLYTSRPPVSVWSLRTVFGLLVLGAVGMALGALFTQN